MAGKGRTAAGALRTAITIFSLACSFAGPTGTEAAETPETLLAAPADLAAVSRAAAREGRAVLVLFSEEGCPYCARLRRDFLFPMRRNEGYRSKLEFHEIDIHSAAPIRDFAGRSTSQREIARRYGVKLLPTVILFGPGGEPLARPLVGYNGPDFYGAYLDERIETALAKLR
jgi:thioredoxin-related protein